MARPIISPVSIHPTAPETFAVLNQRIRVVEEQTNELLKDLQNVNGHSMELFPSKPLGNSEDHQSISPVRTRMAFVGGNDTLWHTCESLVNRMCRLESIIQTVKLNLFRLQTEKELNPKHAVNLEQRLNTIQEEHIEELKVLQTEGRMLSQQLKESREEEKKAKDQVQRLSTALEIATATKRDVTIAAEELRASKNKMNNELQELTEQLSKESSIRESLEESQAVLLYQMREMEVTVEKERKQVHILKQDCNGLRLDIQMSRDRLQKEQEKAVQLEEQCVKLKAELESQECTISKLNEEGKTAQLSLSRQHEENMQLQSEITALREVAEKVQVLNEQLSQQCAELSSTVRRVTMEKAQLIKDHQAALQIEQEKINQKLQEQDLILDAARASIRGELYAVQNEKVHLQGEIQELRAEHASCKQKACEVEKTTAMQKELLESTVARVQSELKAAQQERDSLVKEQTRLEEEMQKTIREITGENKRLEAENERLEAELMEKRLEVGPLKDTTKVLEEENKKLMEQEAAFEHQQFAQQQVKQVLEELTDSRNKLAYDKGKLQTRIKQLEEELQSFTDTCSENNQLRKLNTALETKYSQMHVELGSLRISMQRIEAQLKQAQSALSYREEEFSVAAKARDEALRENQKLKGQISATEEREKHKVINLRRKLEESKEDNVKMTTMLKNLLASHNKMQTALEKVQTDLGRKDSEIADLKKDRNQCQQRVQKLEEELDQCHRQFILQSQTNAKMDPLCKALEVSKAENIKLIQDLEQALQANHALQSKIMLVQDELERKESECQQLLECREQLIEETKTEAKLYAEHLETLKKQFQTEREVTRRAAQKESAELKKAFEEACSKSGETSRLNKELRAKVMELEAALASQKEKVKRQKSVITRYFNTKANNARNEERIKEIQLELRQMEELKEQYQKKNHEQSLSIKEFITELTSLQGEMQQLATNQQTMATENRKLESQLVAERKQRKELEEQCQALEDTVKCLKKCKEETEQKLKEASRESEQITANLEEAHHWFKSKFDSLQHELVKNRQKKKNNYVEEEEQPVKLPNEVCLKRWETKNHLKFVSRKYLNELNK